jgi:hypothetical protein
MVVVSSLYQREWGALTLWDKEACNNTHNNALHEKGSLTLYKRTKPKIKYVFHHAKNIIFKKKIL